MLPDLHPIIIVCMTKFFPLALKKPLFTILGLPPRALFILILSFYLVLFLIGFFPLVSFLSSYHASISTLTVYLHYLSFFSFQFSPPDNPAYSWRSVSVM